ESVRSIREQNWNNVASDGTYHPEISSDHWSLVSGSETIGNFTRQVIISSVERDDSGNIVSSDGTNDPSTKHVSVIISWASPVNGSLTTGTYLTRWENDGTWI